MRVTETFGARACPDGIYVHRNANSNTQRFHRSVTFHNGLSILV